MKADPVGVEGILCNPLIHALNFHQVTDSFNLFAFVSDMWWIFWLPVMPRPDVQAIVGRRHGFILIAAFAIRGDLVPSQM